MSRSPLSITDAIADAEIVLCVTPSQTLRPIMKQIAPHLTPTQILLSASKGIEEKTFLRMSQVMAEYTDGNNPIAVIGGPSFAQEVAAAMPTALSIACDDATVGTRLQNDFSSPSLRVYRNEDIAGTELGGALKNVIALAAGIVAGLELGHNAAAALITRGIAEISRLSIACGGRRETMAGLSGIGDLVLTCSSNMSRNRTVRRRTRPRPQAPRDSCRTQRQGRGRRALHHRRARPRCTLRRRDAHHRADGLPSFTRTAVHATPSASS